MTYNHTLNILKKEKWQSHTCSGLKRDNSKPRRGSFLNYFWTSSIHAVCFCNCYFNFNLRNPRKAYTVSEPQEEKQSKNLTSCGPALMADLDLEKQHGKVIQRRAGGNNKLLEKGMETPSSHVIDLLTTISNCYYWRKIHKEGCQSSPWQQKLLVPSHVPQPRSLHLVHLHKPDHELLIFSVFSGTLG